MRKPPGPRMKADLPKAARKIFGLMFLCSLLLCATVVAFPYLPLSPSGVPPALAGEAPSATEAGGDIQWEKVGEEVISHLQQLIALNSSNPSPTEGTPDGNETAVATYLQKVLTQEGVQCEILEKVPGRGNLMARLKGSGKKKPLLLMAHADVVGVEKSRWSVDPFQGIVKEGFLYGRGSIDDKGMMAAELEIMLLLARSKIPLSRDVIFLAEADEEAGGNDGINWLVKEHFGKIEAEFAINEGGKVFQDHGKVKYTGIQIAEKVPYNFILKARGQGGHASIPRADNPILILGKALARLAAYEPSPYLTPAAKGFFQGLAAISPPELAAACRAVLDSPSGSAVSGLARDPVLMAMVRPTVSPTILRGGFKSNVIPSEAEVNLNVRLLPGQDPEKFRRDLLKAAKGEMLGEAAGYGSLEITFKKSTRPSASSSQETECFTIIRQEAESQFKAPALPFLGTGATDSAILRTKGIQAYGFSPFPLEGRELERVHGADERIPVESLIKGTRVLYDVVKRIAE